MVPRIDFIPSVMAEPKVVFEKALVVGGNGGGDVKPSLLMAPKLYATGCFTLLVLVKAADETEAKYANMIKTNEVRIVLQFILDVLCCSLQGQVFSDFFFIGNLPTNMFLSSHLTYSCLESNLWKI